MNPIRAFFETEKINFYIKVLIVFTVFYIVSGAVLYIVEGYTEEGRSQCRTLIEAYWQLTVYFTSGMENYGPTTAAGRALALLVFLMGLAVVAVFTGKFASVFVVAAQQRRTHLPEFSEHFAICNWNAQGDRIIKELHSPQAEPETEIVVVTNAEVNEQELRESAEYERVFFIRGDPTLHTVLKSARVHLARSVIILAGDDCPDPDARTALIALAITKLERGQREKPHIVAEVKNHHKIQHLLDAGVDEWICASDFGLGIIAQSALAKKISEVYQQLLTYSGDTNEVYVIKKGMMPADLIDHHFDEALKYFGDRRDSDNPIIPIGVRRDGKVILNPRAGDFDRFKQGDELIVMAFQPPSLG
jgi:voltage-gated potassium channel